MKFNVIGTSASTLSTDSLSIHTARLSASTTVIQSGPVTVRLPQDIVGDSSVSSVGRNVNNGLSSGLGVSRMTDTHVTDCYEAAVILAKSSPYVYGLTNTGQVIDVCAVTEAGQVIV